MDGRRTTPAEPRRPRPLLSFVNTGIVAAALLVGIIAGFIISETVDDDPSSADTPGTLTEHDLEDRNSGDTPPCDQLPGLLTADVVAGSCRQNGNTSVLVSASYDCPDGRTLYWNDHGWGYDPGNWQTHKRDDGQLVPPDADMNACQN